MKDRAYHNMIFEKGTIKMIVPFDNHHGLYQVQFEYKGIDHNYIWRPRILERNICRAIPRKTYYQREIIFYDVSTSLKFNSVPFINYFKLNGYVGSLQVMLPRQTYTAGEIREILTNYNSYQINKLVFLDYVCGNLDRHLGNILIHKNKIWLIDNGLSFVDDLNHPRMSEQTNQVIRRYYSAKEMKKVVAEISNKIHNDEFEKVRLRIKNNIGKKALISFDTRLSKALELL